MSNRKRFLAMVLTIVMVVSSFATMNVSASFADVTGQTREFVQALEVLSDLGVVRGVRLDNGDIEFQGGRNVTRQEFALFVARIVSGEPEWFDHPSPGAVEQLSAIFSDAHAINPIFAAAILDCHDRGIITGRTDGRFDPLGTIRFEEAVTMLVRALGITNLPFPLGFMSRAAERDVALIGAFVNTNGFEFRSMAPGADVSRYDMVMLLYNFLLTNYQVARVSWDSIAHRYVTTVDRSPVISRFGITTVVGYITGVTNYAMDLNIRDYSDSLNAHVVGPGHGVGNVPDRPIYLQGTPIRPLMEVGVPTEVSTPGGVIRAPFDIEIGFGVPASTTAGGLPSFTWDTVTGQWVFAPGGVGAGAGGGHWVPQYMLTTKADIGLPAIPEDIPGFMGDRYWLGLRVVVFARTAGAHRNVNLPSAIVIGERRAAEGRAATFYRTVTAGGVVGGVVPTIRVGGPNLTPRGVVELRLTDGISDTPIVFNQRPHVQDLSLTYNLYAMTNLGQLVADRGNRDLTRYGLGRPENTVGRLEIREDSIEQQLAAMIAANGHFDLWFVDNGINRHGEREFFYEFNPFRVARVHGRTDNGIMQIRTNQTSQPVGERGANGGQFHWTDVFNIATRPLSRVEGSPGFEANSLGSIRGGSVNERIAIQPMRRNGAIVTTQFNNEPALYTLFGAYRADLVIHQTLNRIDNAPVAGISVAGGHVLHQNPINNIGTGLDVTIQVAFGVIGSGAAFDCGIPNCPHHHSATLGVRTFNFASGSKALGAMFADNAHSRLGGHRTNEAHLFVHPDQPDVVLMEVQSGTLEATPLYFGVVLSTRPGQIQSAGQAVPAPQTMFVPGAALGRIGYLLEVLDTRDNAVRTVLLSNGFNAQEDHNLVNIRPGEYLSLIPNGDGSYSWAPITNRPTRVHGNTDAVPDWSQIWGGTTGPNEGMHRIGQINDTPAFGAAATGTPERIRETGRWHMQVAGFPFFRDHIAGVRRVNATGGDDPGSAWERNYGYVFSARSTDPLPHTATRSAITSANRAVNFDRNTNWLSANTAAGAGVTVTDITRHNSVAHTVARVTGLTQFIVFGTEGGTLYGNGNAWTARRMTGSSAAIEEILRYAYRVVVMSGATTAAASANAEIVFVSTLAPLSAVPSIERGNYAVVTHVVNTNVGTGFFQAGEAAILGQEASVPFIVRTRAGTSGTELTGTLVAGDLIRLGAETVVDFGVTRRVVSARIDNRFQDMSNHLRTMINIPLGINQTPLAGHTGAGGTDLRRAVGLVQAYAPVPGHIVLNVNATGANVAADLHTFVMPSDIVNASTARWTPTVVAPTTAAVLPTWMRVNRNGDLPNAQVGGQGIANNTTDALGHNNPTRNWAAVIYYEDRWDANLGYQRVIVAVTFIDRRIRQAAEITLPQAPAGGITFSVAPGSTANPERVRPAVFNVGGTVGGTIAVSHTLPAGLTVDVTQAPNPTLTIRATAALQPWEDIYGTFPIVVTRGGFQQTLNVTVAIPRTQDPPVIVNAPVSFSRVTTAGAGMGTVTAIDTSAANIGVVSGTGRPIGNVIRFTATPASGYEVEHWVINGVTHNVTDTSFDLQVTAPILSVQVRFRVADLTAAMLQAYVNALPYSAFTTLPGLVVASDTTLPYSLGLTTSFTTALVGTPNAAVTWASNNTAIITNAGTVTGIPATNTTVTMTATVNVSGITVTRNIDFVVEGKEITNAQDQLNSATLTDLITGTVTNVGLIGDMITGEVNNNLTLAHQFKLNPLFTVNWTSAHPAIDITGNTADVTPGTTNQMGMITATISSPLHPGVTASRDFLLTVPAVTGAIASAIEATAALTAASATPGSINAVAPGLIGGAAASDVVTATPIATTSTSFTIANGFISSIGGEVFQITGAPTFVNAADAGFVTIGTTAPWAVTIATMSDVERDITIRIPFKHAGSDLANTQGDILLTITLAGAPPVAPATAALYFGVTGTGLGTLTAATATAFASGTQLEANTAVTFTATPHVPGYRVREWRVNGAVNAAAGTATTFNFTTPAIVMAVTVTVEFEPIPVELNFSATPSAMGTLTASTTDIANLISGTLLASSTDVVFTASPTGANAVIDWIVNGVSTGETANTVTFTTTYTASTVEVVFGAAPPPPVEVATVTFVATGNGTLTAATATEFTTGTAVASGTEITFTATPAEGYLIDAWTGDAAGNVGATFTTIATGTAINVGVDFVIDPAVVGARASITALLSVANASITALTTATPGNVGDVVRAAANTQVRSDAFWLDETMADNVELASASTLSYATNASLTQLTTMHTDLQTAMAAWNVVAGNAALNLTTVTSLIASLTAVPSATHTDFDTLLGGDLGIVTEMVGPGTVTGIGTITIGSFTFGEGFSVESVTGAGSAYGTTVTIVDAGTHFDVIFISSGGPQELTLTIVFYHTAIGGIGGIIPGYAGVRGTQTITVGVNS